MSDNRIVIPTPYGSPRKKCNRGAELTRTLSLVRPVGMSDEMASDWLAVALVELRQLTDEQFRAGCAAARVECTHHGQIVPRVLKTAGEVGKVNASQQFADDWQRSLKAFSQGYPALSATGSASRLGDVVKRIAPGE